MSEPKPKRIYRKVEGFPVDIEIRCFDCGGTKGRLYFTGKIKCLTCGCNWII